MNKESFLKQEIIDLYRDIHDEDVLHNKVYGRSKVMFTDDKVYDTLMIIPLQNLLDIKGLELLCEKDGYIYGGDIKEIYEAINNDYSELIKTAFTYGQYQKTFLGLTTGGTLQSTIYKLENLGFRFYIEEKEHDLY